MHKKPIIFKSQRIEPEKIKSSKKLVEMGIELTVKNEYNNALEIFNDAIKLDPNNKNAFLNKGRALISMGKYEDGIKCYEKVIELDSFDPVHPINNTDAPGEYLEHKNFEIAPFDEKNGNGLPDENQLLNLDQNMNLKLKHEKLKIKNRYIKIISICDELLIKDPNNIDLLNKKSMALGLNNEYEHAIECCDKILDQKPFDFKSVKNKAYFLSCLDRNDEALECYDEAIKLNSSHIDCHYGKGIVLDRLGEYDDAIACFNKILDLDPTNRAAIINKVVTLGRLNKHEDAWKCYKRIIELENQHDNDLLFTSNEQIDDYNEIGVDDLFQDLDLETTLIQTQIEQPEKTIYENFNEITENKLGSTDIDGSVSNQISNEIPEQNLKKYFQEQKYEITVAMKILQKQRGGSFYYIVEPVNLFKVSILILETLIKEYNMDGVIVCLEKPPKYFQMVLKKKCNYESNIYYINTLSNLVVDYIQTNNDLRCDVNPCEKTVYDLNTENLNLDRLIELIELCMQKIVEKHGAEDHFILFDNIAGLQPYYSLNKIKNFSDKFGVRLTELNLYGIIMAPQGKINIKIMDMIKAIPSIITNKIKKNG